MRRVAVRKDVCARKGCLVHKLGVAEKVCAQNDTFVHKTRRKIEKGWPENRSSFFRKRFKLAVKQRFPTTQDPSKFEGLGF